MEEATIALEAELSVGVWTDIMGDVLLGVVPLHGEYGIRETGLDALVARTGFLRFALDNGESNTAQKKGYYSPGHADVRVGFDESMQVRTKFTYGGTPYYKWVGRVSAPRPTAGLFRERVTNVQAVDWMDQAAAQKISQLAIQTDKRFDQLLPSILADMPIQPRATSFATGVEILSRFFDTDSDEKMSPMSLMAKGCRNELGGLVYLKGDSAGGETLRFDSRHTRPLNQTVLATLDNTMQELEVEYDRSAVRNLVLAKIYPKKVDAAATTVLYTAQQKFSLSPGQSITLILAYRDPTTGRPISATEVVSPLVGDTHYKFGSSEGSANDLNASLGQSMTIGGNTTRLLLTNNAAVTGWLNLLVLWGKGIYVYDPQTFESKDQTSINKRGELTLTWEMEQHDSPVKGEATAAYFKNRLSLPRKVPKRVSFIANQSAALMAAFLQGEPSSRIRLKETMNAFDADCFINGIAFDVLPGGRIKADWTLVPADTNAFFIWNTSRWNIDAYWAF